MVYMVQGFKNGEFTARIVTVADLVNAMLDLNGCAFVLRNGYAPSMVRVEEHFDMAIWVYDNYNNLIEMHFYNGTNETEE